MNSFLIAAVRQKRAVGSESESLYKTGHRHNPTTYLLYFCYFLTPVFNEVETRESPKLFYVPENQKYFN